MHSIILQITILIIILLAKVCLEMYGLCITKYYYVIVSVKSRSVEERFFDGINETNERGIRTAGNYN